MAFGSCFPPKYCLSMCNLEPTADIQMSKGDGQQLSLAWYQHEGQKGYH